MINYAVDVTLNKEKRLAPELKIITRIIRNLMQINLHTFGFD